MKSTVHPVKTLLLLSTALVSRLSGRKIKIAANYKLLLTGLLMCYLPKVKCDSVTFMFASAVSFDSLGC